MCRANCEASKRDLAALSLLSCSLYNVFIKADLVERVLLKKRLIGIGKPNIIALSALKLTGRDQDRDRLAPASKLNFQSRFGLVHDSRQIGPSFSDGTS